MFGMNKGNTPANVPLQTATMTAAAPMAAQGGFPPAPQLGILGQLQNGLANMGQQPVPTPEELQRQQMLQQLQQQQQAQFSPVQFGGAANNGGQLAKYINMLKGGM